MNILTGESGLNVTRPVEEALSSVAEKSRGRHGMEVSNARRKILKKPENVTNKPVQVYTISFESNEFTISKVKTECKLYSSIIMKFPRLHSM